MYYHRLEVRPDASEAKIRSQYKQIARKLHPDKQARLDSCGQDVLGSSFDATAAFQDLQRAYEVLMHLQYRKFYDELLHTGTVGVSDEPSIAELKSLHAKHGYCKNSTSSTSSSGFNVGGPFVGDVVNNVTPLMRAAERGKIDDIVSVLKNAGFSDALYSWAICIPKTATQNSSDAISSTKRSSLTFDYGSTSSNTEQLISTTETQRLMEFVNERSLDTGRSALLYAIRGLSSALNSNVKKSATVADQEISSPKIINTSAAEQAYLETFASYQATMKFLVDLKADINLGNCGGFTALMFAVGNDYSVAGLTDVRPVSAKSEVHNHLQNHPNPNSHSLVHTSSLNFVKFLVDLKADVNAQTNYGLTALMLVGAKKHEIGVSIDKRTSEATNNPSSNNFLHLEKAKFLLSNCINADVSLQTDVGFDAVAFAADNGNFRLVKLLLERSADPNLQFPFRDYRTSLMCACAFGYLEVVEVLLQFKADPFNITTGKLFDSASPLETIATLQGNAFDTEFTGGSEVSTTCYFVVGKLYL